MPMHHIFHTPGTFSEQDKQQLAQRITSFYETLGLPPLYVTIQFIQVEEQNFYVGSKPDVGGKFVRILVDNVCLLSNFKYYFR
jgi:phenylpyruvate tautomerase PptA (4-oxalocrotonate tautomerase family)